MQEREVFVVQAVTRIDLQAEAVRLVRRDDQAFQFCLALALAVVALRKRAGVQLDELRANVR